VEEETHFFPRVKTEMKKRGRGGFLYYQTFVSKEALWEEGRGGVFRGK